MTGSEEPGSDDTLSNRILAQERIDAWTARGAVMDTPDGQVFVVDTGATGEGTTGAVDAGTSGQHTNPPLLILHGFPTCSFDFAGVIDGLAQDRRVVLFDQIGFGLSDKPDRRYGIHLHADTAEHVISATGLTEFDLLTHDMGDSVGGELLARDAGDAVRRRVITNGSIYLDLAQLTIGQQLLMGLPDEATDELPVDGFVAGVIGTYAHGGSDADPVDSVAHGLLAQTNGGLTLMARLIRYLEDRQREESRYTGAIESHRSPLHIVWGDLDPVAVVAMSQRLLDLRIGNDSPGPVDTADPTGDGGTTTIEILDGVGHYPMIESPERFTDAVLRGLDQH